MLIIFSSDYIKNPLFAWSIDLPLPRHFKNWSTEIRNILIEIGQGHIWNTEYIPVSYDYFLSMAKGTLIDLYITEWYRDVNNKDKHRTYRTIKKVYNYLSMNSPNVRRSFTRLRTSSHCLEIEMGRYPPRTAANHGYCKQCNTYDRLLFGWLLSQMMVDIWRQRRMNLNLLISI